LSEARFDFYHAHSFHPNPHTHVRYSTDIACIFYWAAIYSLTTMANTV